MPRGNVGHTTKRIGKVSSRISTPPHHAGHSSGVTTDGSLMGYLSAFYGDRRAAVTKAVRESACSAVRRRLLQHFQELGSEGEVEQETCQLCQSGQSGQVS